MAPQAHLNQQGWATLQLETGHIEVRPWTAALDEASAASEVWIEAFGCELPDHFVQGAAQQAENTPTSKHAVWLNLEYLSAESYVERSHKLPSPVMSGPLKGRKKWFFYPGFTDKTGGLIRECHQTRAIAQSELQATKPFPLRSSLFCYEPEALPEVLQLRSFNSAQHQWHVAHGRGAKAFAEAMALVHQDSQGAKPQFQMQPPVSQTEFDDVLLQSDLNFVRGEDSLVRALWAGKAFIWHIYPQEDGAHGPKLEAFLDWLQAPPSLRLFHRRWNGLSQAALPEVDLPLWQACALSARTRLMTQMDLVSQLLQFVAEKR
jgi:uncharacterized repeat protein (TIGR03837 family)